MRQPDTYEIYGVIIYAGTDVGYEDTSSPLEGRQRAKEKEKKLCGVLIKAANKNTTDFSF